MIDPVRPARVLNSRAARVAALQIALDTARGCGLETTIAKRLVGKIWRELRRAALPNRAIRIGALKAMVRHQALEMPDELIEELARQAQDNQG